jgi:hypothetical protein
MSDFNVFGMIAAVLLAVVVAVVVGLVVVVVAAVPTARPRLPLPRLPLLGRQL